VVTIDQVVAVSVMAVFAVSWGPVYGVLVAVSAVLGQLIGADIVAAAVSSFVVGAVFGIVPRLVKAGRKET